MNTDTELRNRPIKYLATSALADVSVISKKATEDKRFGVLSLLNA